MKAKIQIKSIYGKVLFEYEKENNTIKETIEEAVKQWAGLHGADLRETDLHGADLQWANLHGANLQGADLQRANLQGADLQRANLQGADLQETNLQETDLRGANLDFSCLPLWCGGKFKADNKICKQLVAHTLEIMKLSGEGSKTLLKSMESYKKGWHRENEF